jgi:hypothetical protein
MEANVNWLAIVVATISAFAIGAIWYSPLLFAKAWMKEAGITEEKTKQANMAKTFGLAFILTFIMATNLAFFFGSEIDFVMGIFYGLLTGLGWVAFSMGVIYLFEQRSLKLWLINGGYLTVAFTVMGGILGAWH